MKYDRKTGLWLPAPISRCRITPIFNPLMLGGGYPTAPVTGMTGWWRSDNVTTSLNFVTKWLDKSGNGFDIAPGLHPSYNASDANWGNLPSIQFDGATQYLVSAVSSHSIVENAAFECFAALRPTAAGASNAHSALLSIVGDEANFWGFGVGSSQILLQINGGGGNIIGSNFSINQSIGFNCRFDNGSIYAKTSGQTENNLAASAIANLTNLFDVGRNSSFLNFFAGTMTEIIVYNAAQTAANRQINRNYFAGRYGIQW